MLVSFNVAIYVGFYQMVILELFFLCAFEIWMTFGGGGMDESHDFLKQLSDL